MLAATILPFAGVVLLGSVDAATDVCDGTVDENTAREEDLFAMEEGIADIAGSGGMKCFLIEKGRRYESVLLCFVRVETDR